MINQEQLEANQQDIDEDRIYRMQFLEKESKDKIDFVEKELVKFQKKGIPVYIYAHLPAVDDDGKKFESVYHYNNLQSFMEWDEKGHLKPDSAILLHKVNKGLVYHIVRLFGNIIGYPETFEEYIEKIQKSLKSIYSIMLLTITKDTHLERLEKEKNDKDKNQNNHM